MKKLVLLPFLLLTPVVGLMALSPSDDSTVLARSGDIEITTSDLRAALRGLDVRSQQAVAHDPALLGQTANLLLAERLAFREATVKHWDQQPAVLAELAALRQKLVVESYLDSVSRPPDDFPTEADLRKAYDANRASLQVPREIRLAQIFISVPGNADPSATAQAQSRFDAIRTKLASPSADFSAIARTDSNDKTTAARGGEIGWLLESQVQPEIRDQVATLAKGAVSSPIKLRDGWHVLKVLDVREAHPASFDEVRTALVQKFRAQRAQTDRQAYLAKLLAQNPATINQQALAALAGEVGAGPATK